MTSIAFKLATFFSEQTSNFLNEFAIDFMIDESENIFIAELNTKPGLSGSPDLFGNFQHMTNYEKQIYEKYTLNHGKYLAQFLIKKYKEN